MRQRLALATALACGFFAEHLTLGAELVNDLPMRRPGRGSTEANLGASGTFHDGLKIETAFGRRMASRDASADAHGCVDLAVEF